ncbi:MAG: hypothetical protein AB7Q37_18540 [Pyrinomonadaceae bacterium]
MLLSNYDLENILEALKSAYAELEELEREHEWYCTTGHLMDHMEEAMGLLEQALE